MKDCKNKKSTGYNSIIIKVFIALLSQVHEYVTPPFSMQFSKQFSKLFQYKKLTKRVFSNYTSLSLNGKLSIFGFCDFQTKYYLFVSYCTSFHGVRLWDLQHRSVNGFYITWIKAIRRLFGLPINTHCHLLSILSGCLPIQSQLLNRCANYCVAIC